jgi:murein DD-endopeptidase MepM/ murein hydrolase activator NlpD
VKTRFWVASVLVALLVLAVAAAAVRERRGEEKQASRMAALAERNAERAARHLLVFSERALRRGSTFTRGLERLGVDPQTAAGIAGSAQSVYDLRQLQAGNTLAAGWSAAGGLRAVRYQIDDHRVLWVERAESGFHAAIKTIPTRREQVVVAGRIEDSLFHAVTDAGETPELAMRLAGIFGWDLDFYTDPRPGDTFRVLVEKNLYEDGRLAGYGRVLAAQYNNAGRKYQALLFHDAAGRPAYYQPNGQSLQKMFLRSPLKFAAPITSHFSYHRFHPILKRYLPHLGIDYGAPVGTPVQAVSGGRVAFAGRDGGAGGMVELSHANGYQTLYLHLSRILVRRGQRVAQGQRIGLVGMTGLATGPHLDFRIKLRGRYLNFERLRLPPARPVAPSDWKQFVAARDRWLDPLLLAGSVLHARAGAPAGLPGHPSAAVAR